LRRYPRTKAYRLSGSARSGGADAIDRIAGPLALSLPSRSIRGVESSFYEIAGSDSYVATGATAGPWSADAQHGGPPSALAVTAMERHEPDGRQRLARVTVDILRPIPVGKVSLRTRMIRPGRRVALVETVMEADGVEVMHARGWRIERPAGEVPAVPASGGGPAPVPPASSGPPPAIFERNQRGYLAAIEWRFMAAADGALGRAAWTRPRIALLPDEEPSPMSRALLVADSGSGLGAVLPPSKYLFINVDITVVLPRDPAGAWLLLESSTTIGSDGAGLATTQMSDPVGRVGCGWQTLLVAPR
jgi:hypothetical protein